MNVEIKKYLFDISESIDSIEKYLGDKRDFNVYLANKMLRNYFTLLIYLGLIVYLIMLIKKMILKKSTYRQHTLYNSWVSVACECLVLASAFLSVDKNAARKPNRFILSNVTANAKNTSYIDLNVFYTD